MEDGKLDIGLIGKPDNQKNINFFPLQEIEDIFVATHDYLCNLQIRGVNRQHILQSSTLMLLDKENITRQYIDSYFEKNHILLHNVIEVSNLDLLIEMTKTSLGVGCVIRDFIKTELQTGALLEIPLKHPIHKREIGFAYSKNIKISKSLKHFIDFCRIENEDPPS